MATTSIFDEKIAEFNSLSKFHQNRLIQAGELYFEQVKKEEATINNKRDCEIVSLIEDDSGSIAIIKSYNKDYKKYPYTCSVFKSGEWRESNTFYNTLEKALLYALEFKYNQNGFTHFAGKMLGIKDEE